MNQSAFINGLVVLLVVLLLRDRVPYVGRLPGDFYLVFGRLHVFVPLASGLLVGLVLAVLRGVFGGR